MENYPFKNDERYGEFLTSLGKKASSFIFNASDDECQARFSAWLKVKGEAENVKEN